VNTLFASIVSMFSMFSTVPMPQVAWNKDSMRYLLASLPLVGVVIGLVLWGWLAFCRWLGIGAILFAAGVVLLPLAVSGGIHMDGFCDTVDALASHVEPARKREILKDPHTGAFAVIGAAAYLLAYFAAATELPQTSAAVWTLGVFHVLSRSVGALAGTVSPSSVETGLLYGFRSAADRKVCWFLLGWIVLCGVCLGMLWTVYGLLLLLPAALCLAHGYRMQKREFGGMSGDLAGHLITLTELASLLGLVIFTKVVSI